MDLTTLEAISPIDGRYRGAAQELARYFSEGALIRYRVKVEIEYFIALCAIPLPQLREVNKDSLNALRDICNNFTEQDAQRVKDIEKTTNHDVKSVEYFLKERFVGSDLERYKEFIHFGLTSQDINNTAIPLQLKEAWNEVLLPITSHTVSMLKNMAIELKDIPMLARTHGQPASPTSLGKELFVFVDRLERQLDLIDTIPFSAKFGGATGNFNAHHVSYPEIDWISFGNNFLNNSLGLTRSRVTTQIDHYDNLAAFLDNLKRINNIFLDLCRDLWSYISMEYFTQKIKQGEVGSSAMPHKVNPIDFENAEGNLGIANAIFEHLSAKLPISRLQRDLTDSTVTRNIGVPVAHSIVALKSLQRGLKKIIINQDKINSDLNDNWAVVAEAIQTILRREGFPRPYEALKGLTRTNRKIDKDTIHGFIRALDIDQEVKKELLRISPDNYTGIYDF